MRSNATTEPRQVGLELLRATGLAPVLADVGSAGVSHKVWRPIAPHSVLVGFDPDTRNRDTAFGEGYGRAVLVEKAVSPDDGADSLEFVLTEYPSCSSSLEPDLEALASFSFRDFFRPISRTSVPATSLNRVIDEHALGAIHWLKLDSQGTDLRLLRSLADRHLRTLLAVDIEPGLIKAYKGEDLFTDCHAWLVEQGFWMSRLEFQSYPKLRPETLAAIARQTGTEASVLMRRLPKAPTAVEGRYLRELSWLEAHSRGPEPLIIAFVFAMLDAQQGYGYDLATLYAERFGEDRFGEIMQGAALAAIG